MAKRNAAMLARPSCDRSLLGHFQRNRASKSRFVVGSHVWVEDPDEAWMDGLVEEINGVLQNLKSRYALNEIYTYTGNILIAVNPFQRFPHLYNNHMMGIYKGAEFGELSPHPFAIADRSYRLMINDRISQAILVSGESGAGKTESTKSLMQYLAYMGGKAQAEGRSVQQQILESNPVLEAFGNAKTVRNNNSSRFGKFVEIQFDANGKISGAAIRTYILERSRVCQISDPERNYHCFYMLCASPPERVMATRGESITKNLDPRAAALSRDALARIVYSRLFDCLVNKINSSIGQDPDSKILIGVLDIYGFESFLTNSFEQFCINLTNEKLQQHFNQVTERKYHMLTLNLILFRLFNYFIRESL
ncbi:hypothetical protein C2845_PM02G40730 [Panicum miliaceum]|uniref:Myosin motor domain-containing protein n=1 Tax=Panicum miliaceum TaxID=4540 RepID=A0A3L6S5C2_PANMI|nr:hypothetical protein C2845_PM02G40730 [Panicum miliaceum]